MSIRFRKFLLLIINLLAFLQIVCYNELTTTYNKGGVFMVDLKQRRKELGLTMSEVAEAVGVSEATISRYESGNIMHMREHRIAKYAEVLKVPTNEFVDERMIMQGNAADIHIIKNASTANGRSAVIDRINSLSDEQFEKLSNKLEGYLDGLEDK